MYKSSIANRCFHSSMVRLAALLCSLFHCFLSAQKDADPSLLANMFGSCRLQEVDSFPSFSNESTVFYYYRTLVAQQSAALSQYLSLPLTLTQVNEKLAQGIVRGKSASSLWASRKDNSWQYPAAHPRRNKTNCVLMNEQAVPRPLSLYAPMRHLSTDFYLLMQRNALLHEAGVMATSCGYFQALEGCETTFRFLGRKWFEKCSRQLQQHHIPWPSATSADSPLLQPEYRSLCLENPKDPKAENFSYVQKVFVASSVWDHNYHHLLIDVLPRLVHYLPYLLQHPEVKIHIRRSEKYAKPPTRDRAVAMKRRILQLVGLDAARLVSGPVIASEALLPRSMMCNMPVLNALEVRKLAAHLIQRAGVVDVEREKSRGRDFPFTPLPASTPPLQQQTNSAAPKVILLQVRHCHVGMKCSNSWRTWDPSTSHSITTAFQQVFPHSRILVANDSTVAAADCLACEVRGYGQVDLLVGLHGAGMTNLIFMPPGSALFEITGQYDGRMMAGCGYHGNLASSFGVHHYIYYYDWRGGEQLDGVDMARRAKDFYLNTRPQG